MRPQRTRPPPGFFKESLVTKRGGLAEELEALMSSVGFVDSDFNDDDGGWKRRIVELALTAINGDPLRLGDALSGPETNQWTDAYTTEIDRLASYKTFDIVERPNDKTNVAKCVVALRKKLGPKGEVVKYKARIC
ncbi:hypothetical protein F5050DRAFT_1716767, partial [Lentinula boryana]